MIPGGYFYLGILAVLALLSQWLLTTVESALRRPPDNQHIPTLYVDDFTGNRMNNQGRRDYTLIGPRLVGMPDPQGTRITRPVLNLFQEDGRTLDWLIEAETGWISPHRDQVRLEGAVTMTRPASSGRTPTVITTTDVLVDPNARTAETTAPVRVESPNGWATAVGAKAFLHERRVEMYSQVREHYVRTPKP